MNFSTVVSDPNYRNSINSIANGPMALYERHDGATVFLAPHSNFMTEQHRVTPGPDGHLAFGPGGELVSLYAGFAQETIVVLGTSGITATTLAWGKRARAAHTPPQPKIPDITLSQ